MRHTSCSPGIDHPGPLYYNRSDFNYQIALQFTKLNNFIDLNWPLTGVRGANANLLKQIKVCDCLPAWGVN